MMLFHAFIPAVLLLMERKVYIIAQIDCLSRLRSIRQVSEMLKNILVPIDFNEPSSWEKVFPFATDEARLHGATLHVMTMVPSLHYISRTVELPTNIESTVQKETEQRLATIVKENMPDDLSPQLIIRNGSVYEEILQTADQVKADLILMASHKPSAKTYLLGSNAARVVRHAQCSVAVIR